MLHKDLDKTRRHFMSIKNCKTNRKINITFNESIYKYFYYSLI